MINQRNELKQFEQFPIVSNQFEYVEFGLIKEGNLFTVIYTFVRPDHKDKTIKASCTVETNIKSLSYSACAKSIAQLISIGFFTVPVSATGNVFDANYNELGEINWNTIQREGSVFEDDLTTPTVH